MQSSDSEVLFGRGLDGPFEVLILQNPIVVDVRAGDCQKVESIVIEGGHFSHIGGRENPGRRAASIEADGFYVCPGLIDAHAHVCLEADPALYPGYSYGEDEVFAVARGVRNMSIALRAGVTTVRDLGCPSDAVFHMRQLSERGVIASPRIFAAGELLTGVNGWGKRLGREVRDIEDAVLAVDSNFRRGADCIKIINDPIAMASDIAAAIIQRAHDRGLPVAFHAFTDEAILMAAELGADTIEHGAPSAPDVRAAVRESGAYLVPTYVCALESAADFELSQVDDSTRHFYTAWLAQLDANIGPAFDVGIPIVAGTDAGFPPTGFDAVVREVVALARLGLNSTEALSSATCVAADALGCGDSLGAIELGRRADFCLYAQNPLTDLDVLSTPRAVFVDGVPMVMNGVVLEWLSHRRAGTDRLVPVL